MEELQASIKIASQVHCGIHVSFYYADYVDWSVFFQPVIERNVGGGWFHNEITDKDMNKIG